VEDNLLKVLKAYAGRPAAGRRDRRPKVCARTDAGPGGPVRAQTGGHVASRRTLFYYRALWTRACWGGRPPGGRGGGGGGGGGGGAPSAPPPPPASKRRTCGTALRTCDTKRLTVQGIEGEVTADRCLHLLSVWSAAHTKGGPSSFIADCSLVLQTLRVAFAYSAREQERLLLLRMCTSHVELSLETRLIIGLPQPWVQKSTTNSRNMSWGTLTWSRRLTWSELIRIRSSGQVNAPPSQTFLHRASGLQQLTDQRRRQKAYSGRACTCASRSAPTSTGCSSPAQDPKTQTYPAILWPYPHIRHPSSLLLHQVS
jgi:hypothetical protein